MVSSSARLSVWLAVAFALAQSHAAPADLDQFPVPAFDFSTVSASSKAVLDALSGDGILALSNIPGFTEKRQAYLRAATQCALAAGKNGDDYLLHKTLNDGTKRYTISTTSGKELSKAGADVDARCPGYAQAYRAFSQIVEDAVTKLGQTLDATSFRVSKPSQVSGAELLTSSVHLDHFHAYEAAPSASGADDLLSLDMHTDNGMLIAMTAPKYFDVASGDAVQDKSLQEYESGLLIETRAGKLVRPVLKEDELVLMVGSGFQEWVATTPALRPVPHGMKYPRVSFQGERLIRAWFGKMMLLNPEERMLNMDMTFGEYAARTTRYLLGEMDHDSGFASLACPHGRRLHDNDKKCVVKQCFPKAGKDPEVPCAIQCNLNPVSRPGADRLCEENCECQEKPGNASAAYCWMLCVEQIPEGQCDAKGQRCKTGVEAPYMVDQAYICASNASNSSTVQAAPSPVPAPKSSPATLPLLGAVAATLPVLGWLLV
ncbi:hypothetical protein ATCC90586_007252 [Pythium insidiosum]|nr:hypothetical protein ATCC90586_007252 [Pythium insidiosum]